MPTTIMAEQPTPVSIRATNSPVGSHTNALSSDKPAYHTVARIRALLRPRRSENQPPIVAPMNIPAKVADVMKPTFEIERCQLARMAGAETEKLYTSPNS